jgi:outer membrane beta-barrel protein
MRTTLIILAMCIAVAPPAGRAEEMPGIDLSNPAKEPPRTPPAEPAKPGDSSELPPIDLSKPPPQPEQRPSAEAKPQEVAPFSENDVALGDKVKAVQRKGFIKRHRFEVAPQLSLSVNDPYYQKFGGGLRIAYSLQDSFALALRGTYFTPLRRDAVREGKLAFQSQLLSSQLYGLAMLDGVWSPIYGKASFLNKNIIHFDLYLSAGFGLAWSATSLEPRSEGPHFATDLGGGVRFYPKEWMAFELGLNATLYPDQPIKSVPGTVQKVFVANVGFSFFFPTTFEYEHP